MSELKVDENDVFKKEIQENLMKFQAKFKKVLAAEKKISEQKPLNTSRLEKQKAARMVLSKEMERLCNYLIEMGDPFEVKRRRGLNS